MVEFMIAGEPKGKERPRARVIKAPNGKYIPQVYTPTGTAEYEQKVRVAYALQCGGTKVEQGVPCAVHIRVGYPIPKSKPKRQRELMVEGKLLPTVKPDVDNVAKAILDALNGAAFQDDAQVVMLTISKAYMENPETSVIIQEMRGDRR